MRGLMLSAGLAVTLALAACSPRGADDASRQRAAEIENQTVDVPQTVTQLAPGTTPVAERVAVLGLLNKRNGLERDLTLRPGQAVRVGDVIVRLRNCETTAPWEPQQYTGAFVQLDVRGADNQFRRVFSGWLFKESPSLNVVEHAVYDVWPKSCEMTYPAGPAAPAAPASSSNRSSAPKSGAPSGSRPSTSTPAPAEPPAAAPPPSETANNAT